MHAGIVKAVAFSLVLSLVDARRLDLRKRSGAAITRVDTDSVAGAPWFEYEKHQLVHDSIDFGSEPELQSGECKTFPGDSSWPSESAWSDLDGLLNGSLIQSVPVAAPCYKDWGVYNKEQCDVIRSNFSNPYFQ